MLRWKSCLAAAIVSAIVLASCGAGTSREEEKYYFVAFSTQLPYFQDAQAGLLSAGAEIGVAVEMIGPASYDPQAQKAALDRVIAEVPPPSGILVTASDATLLTPSINSAVSRGINVITIDSDAPDSDRLSFIGTNNYRIGQMAAEVVAEQLGGSGGVVVYTTAGQPNLEQRLAGFTEVFDRSRDLSIVEQIDIKGDAAVASEATENQIAARTWSRVGGLVCLQAVACPAVAEVLMSNDVEGKVVIAMDTDDRTLDWVRQGLIHATIAQRPFTMAFTGLRLLADLHKYPPRAMESEGSLSTVPQSTDTGTLLITAQNVDSFVRDRESHAAAVPSE